MAPRRLSQAKLFDLILTPPDRALSIVSKIFRERSEEKEMFISHKLAKVIIITGELQSLVERVL